MTICRFRHFLEQHGIQEKLFAISRSYMEKHSGQRREQCHNHQCAVVNEEQAAKAKA